MIVRILGAIDVICSLTLLCIIFGITPYSPLLLFCAGLLFLKGLFIFTGEPLSLIDLLASATFIFTIFMAPWSLLLWMLTLLLLAKGIVSFLFAAGLAYLFYQTSVFIYGFSILPFMLILLLSGWWVGFLIASVIMRFGSKVQTLAWSLPWVFAPFSAIYYPVSILPDWAQHIALLLPTSYVFEGMREVLKTGTFNTQYFLIGLLLNIVYISITLFLLNKSFKSVVNRGVTKLY